MAAGQNPAEELSSLLSNGRSGIGCGFHSGSCKTGFPENDLIRNADKKQIRNRKTARFACVRIWPFGFEILSDFV